MCLGASLVLAPACDRDGPAETTNSSTLRGAPIDAPPSATAAVPTRTEPDSTAALVATPPDASVALDRTPALRATPSPQRPPAAARSGTRSAVEAATAVSFDQLRDYSYEPPTPEQLAAAGNPRDAVGQIPAPILALNDRRVAIEGFMAPLRIEDGRVTAFMLCYNRMFCCFGLMPAMNEWIFVELADGRSTEYFNDVVVGVSGTLEVGEKVQDGMVMSLYRLRADRVTFRSGM